MKNIIIVLVISLFSVISANAQKSANYISLANSNNDTLQYLNNNFIMQKAKYLGQPLSKILNDLELKIVDCYSIDYVPPGLTAEDVENIAGLNLGVYNLNEFDSYFRDRIPYGKRYTLSVNTKELMPRSEYETLIFKNPANVDADVKALYSGSNYVVADIEVTPYVNSPQSRTFTKSDCGLGGVGSTFPITVPAGTYFSYYSQADADAQAQAFVNNYYQWDADKLGTCTYTFFASKGMRSVGFRKNNCPASKTGSMVYFSAVEGAFTSTISHEDADAQAQAAGQANANAKGTCK